MDNEKIIVVDENNEKKMVERFEYYAKLMEMAYGNKKKGDN